MISKTRVKDLMIPLSDYATVTSGATLLEAMRALENDSLAMAIHQIVMGQHQSLLVTKRKKVVGILRSTDAFNALYNQMEMDKPS